MINYNTENNFLKSKLEDGTNGLIASFGELGKYKLKEKYLTFFHQFTRYEPDVLAIQTYNYNLISRSLEVGVKLTTEYGYVSEKVDMNAIIQGYYSFKKRDLKELRNALLRFNILGEYDGLLNFIIRKDNNRQATHETRPWLNILKIS